jgi:hypothetical protein
MGVLERGERRKKRVKEWGSLGARHGRGSLLRVRKETGRRRREEKRKKRRKRKEKKKGKNERKKERKFFSNLEISKKIKDTL